MTHLRWDITVLWAFFKKNDHGGGESELWHKNIYNTYIVFIIRILLQSKDYRLINCPIIFEMHHHSIFHEPPNVPDKRALYFLSTYMLGMLLFFLILRIFSGIFFSVEII